MNTQFVWFDFDSTRRARRPAAALTLVASAVLAGFATPSWSLGLGRVAVQSTLGDPLRAEIDVTGATPEDLATLKVAIASPDAFQAAGVAYHPALVGAQASVQRRGGRTVVVLTGDRSVSEPFVDVVLDLNWSSGKLQRAYTLLVDPAPQPNTAVAGVTTPVQISAAPAPAPVSAPAPTRPAAVAARPPAPQPPATSAPKAPAAAAPKAPVASAPKAATPTTPRAQPAAQGSAASSYTVRGGDTLSRIAASQAHRSGVSLDQMLVALYRANPDAFRGENMNRLRAGAVLRVPAGGDAQGVSVAEARQVIAAHSADFAAYRGRLAGVAQTAPAVGSKEPPRQTSGTVQAKVDDAKTAATPPPADRLKLSQGAVAAHSAEAKISAASEKKAADARVAELSRNLDELKQVAAASSASQSVAAAASAPGITLPLPSPVAAASAASQPVPTAVAAASAVVKPVSAPAATPVPVHADNRSWFESLSEHPLFFPVAAGGVALLALLGLLRLRRRQTPLRESAFLESQLQPPAGSFFGGVDDHAAGDDASAQAPQSTSYSLSQLDAIGDVDPVAEADVYLAYGRDLQAEEILKDALRTNPNHLPSRLKLLEVYAKRADLAQFELQAQQVRELAGEGSAAWHQAQMLGSQIDASNPLYGQDLAGGVDIETSPEVPPGMFDDAPMPLRAGAPVDPSLGTATEPLDLMLTSAFGNEAQADADAAADRKAAPTAPIDFDATVSQSLGALPEFAEDAPASAPAAAPEPVAFDFGDLSLELEPQATLADAGATSPSSEAEALLRKLELAEEFQQIGDVDGARDLVDEVLASDPDAALHSRAQALRATLD